jgi:hypothetical protein
VHLKRLDLFLEHKQPVLGDIVLAHVGNTSIIEQLQHEAVVAVIAHCRRLLLGNILIYNAVKTELKESGM